MSAAVIVIRRKQFIRRFREQGATAPDKAIPYTRVGMRRSWIFNQMVARGVFVPVGNDCYYLSEPAAEEFLAAQARKALIFAGVLLFIFLVFLLASTRW